MEYPTEHFDESEQERLAAHFTNIDRPVFALVNLPETVKGALFARYSRYSGTLRRLFLDEFADSLPEAGSRWDGEEGKRAADLYDRIFLGYGDDSVAQLGGAHIACEWVSNVVTKLLQRPRLASYLEQSTRYIPYDSAMPDGGYRYYRESALGHEYDAAMDEIFTIYSQSLPRLITWLEQQYPPTTDEPAAARTRALKAKALDLLRGLLPAASLSHMGMFASGQAYEQLILHLLAHPLPEARFYGQEMLKTMEAVMPSFVARIPRPDRGGEWVEYLKERDQTAARWVERLQLDRDVAAASGPSVRLVHVDGNEDELLAALLFEASELSELEILDRVSSLSTDEKAAALTALTGKRTNRRHRPGRGLEALRYRFEVVSDYGAFRDLQRHRLLTAQWQRLSPQLGAEIPQEVIDAGLSTEFERALEVSREQYERLQTEGVKDPPAPYPLCLAYRIRYILDMNAREAMHLIELRSGREGHPSYRAVAHEMHRHIAEVHPSIAQMMNFVDTATEPRLERILSEIRQSNLRCEC